MSDFLQWPPDPVAAVMVIAALVLIILAMLIVLLRSSNARRRAVMEAKEGIEGTARKIRRLETDHDFLVDFFKIFANLLAEMHALRQTRTIPDALLKAIVRIYRPEVAAVLVRRGSASDTNDPLRLTVAAVHSTRGIVRDGIEYRFGEGQVGIVAERQQVMVRKDFDVDQMWSYERSRVSSEPEYDIVAPMMAGNETIGVLAVSRPERHHQTERDVLEMIARIGALTSVNVRAYQDKAVQADVDKLTRILNKGALLQRLGLATHQARERGGQVSVFIFDLDNFKVYNDTNGHLAGDRLLSRLAGLVKETVRADDVFGRFGGEEFLLVMPGRSRAQALTAASMVRKTIEEFDFEGGETQPLGRVTISGGVACFPEDAPDSVELLRVADEALYRAKQDGRNRVEEARPAGLNPY
ncbi:MAG: sensor domain-containing diguanylate cyclase [Holophagae bacterium]